MAGFRKQSTSRQTRSHGMCVRLQKYFGFEGVKALDAVVAKMRRQSPYELELMIEAGDIHRRVMEGACRSCSGKG